MRIAVSPSNSARKLILGLGLLLIFFCVAPGTRAQTPAATGPTAEDCKKNPAPAQCISYDPAVNPLLVKAGWTAYVANTPNPQNVEGKGVCQRYQVGILGSITGAVSREGCVRDGKFTLYEDSVIVDGAAGVVSPPITEQTNQDGTREITTPPAGDTGSCSLNPLSWGDCFMKAVATLVLGLANFLLATAGILLNWVVIKTVFQFGNLIGNSPGILLAWGIMRDIGNMLLLFGFILMGLGTILDLHSFPTRKAIPKLLVFAVLMNFSLFAAEAVIDTSNALSSVIYAQANTDNCLLALGTTEVSTTGQTQEACAANYGLAGHIMQSTGLSSIFKTNGGTFANATTYFMMAIFAIIGAVVLFAAAILLVIRVVILSFLMVSAPIGFAGMAIPPMQKFANDWWHKLISQSFFAPIMFLLIFISLKITDTFAGGTNESLAAAVSQNSNASVMGIILVFTLVIGFMIASLVAAKSMGAAGASFAVSTASKVVNGTMGYAGRNTAGKWSGKLNDNIRKSEFGQTRFGRRLATITEKGSKASFDLRGNKSWEKLGKKIGDTSKPGKDGYQGQIKHQSEEYKKYSDSLKQTAGAKAEQRRIEEQNEDAEKVKGKVGKEKEEATKVWSNSQKQMQEEIARQQSALKYDDESRKRSLDLQQKKVEAAVASGDTVKQAEEQAELDRLSTRYRTDRESQTATLATIQEGLRSAEAAHKKNIEKFDADIEAADKSIAANKARLKGNMDKGEAGFDSDSSKRGFGIKLAKSKAPPWKGVSRKKAFDAIRDDLKKSKTEKALEKIKEGIDKGSHDTAHKLEEIEEDLHKDAGGKTGGAADSHGHH